MDKMNLNELTLKGERRFYIQATPILYINNSVHQNSSYDVIFECCFLFKSTTTTTTATNITTTTKQEEKLNPQCIGGCKCIGMKGDRVCTYIRGVDCANIWLHFSTHGYMMLLTVTNSDTPQGTLTHILYLIIYLFTQLGFLCFCWADGSLSLSFMITLANYCFYYCVRTRRKCKSLW